MKSVTTLYLIITGLAAFSGSAFAADVARGENQFEYWCATCHGPDMQEGRYLAGTAALLVKYDGQLPGALAERTDLAVEYVKFVVRQGSEGMPFFRKTEVSESELEDIAAYLSRTDR
ncbi:MAG: p-cresol methylhydroxylase [SAR86 cluster bacterium]|uniref:p-cresol methylhydroxylase n=1 Tax=SAR86 cluster bacterium TaxID=2030880 RepID=A0A2A5C664_9GAMM|nr:MAG: p-cresol methylhydroxylase [SAR86 cluster bacterium]